MATAAKLAQQQLADLLFPVRAAREDEDSILNVPLNERRLQTETYDFTVSTLETLLRDEKIVIPEFQRKYVWTRVQASRLIESLIIQCPIPVIYLDQEDDGTLKVIDGNQRLMSIKLYLGNGFRLRGLKAFPDLNGLLFRDLDPRFRSHIENRTLRCITILKETHPQIKFDVFERLNTGAVQLNPQELRHGIYHGAFMSKLDDLGKNEIWQTLSGIKDDKRMRGAELILRFLALTFELENYEKPLASFLNSFAQKHRQGNRNSEFEEAFNNAVDSIHKLLGDRAFRLLDEKRAPDNNFNAAIFDAQMVGMATSGVSINNVTKTKKDRFIEDYHRLQIDRDFLRSISASTSDPPLVLHRISKFRDLIERSFEQ